MSTFAACFSLLHLAVGLFTPVIVNLTHTPKDVVLIKYVDTIGTGILQVAFKRKVLFNRGDDRL